MLQAQATWGIAALPPAIPLAPWSQPAALPPTQPIFNGGVPSQPSSAAVPWHRYREAQAAAQEIKRKLLKIYSVVKPENVGKMDHLMAKYAGQESFLFESVCQKYNLDLERWEDGLEGLTLTTSLLRNSDLPIPVSSQPEPTPPEAPRPPSPRREQVSPPPHEDKSEAAQERPAEQPEAEAEPAPEVEADEEEANEEDEGEDEEPPPPPPRPPPSELLQPASVPSSPAALEEEEEHIEQEQDELPAGGVTSKLVEAEQASVPQAEEGLEEADEDTGGEVPLASPPAVDAGEEGASSDSEEEEDEEDEDYDPFSEAVGEVPHLEGEREQEEEQELTLPLQELTEIDTFLLGEPTGFFEEDAEEDLEDSEAEEEEEAEAVPELVSEAEEAQNLGDEEEEEEEDEDAEPPPPPPLPQGAAVRIPAEPSASSKASKAEPEPLRPLKVSLRELEAEALAPVAIRARPRPAAKRRAPQAGLGREQSAGKRARRSADQVFAQEEDDDSDASSSSSSSSSSREPKRKSPEPEPRAPSIEMMPPPPLPPVKRMKLREEPPIPLPVAVNGTAATAEAHAPTPVLGGTSTSAPSNKRPVQRRRQTLDRMGHILKIFHIITDNQDHARSKAMQRFAVLSGWEGTDESWQAEYQNMCEEQKRRPEDGFTLGAFIDLLNDSKGIMLDDAELMETCEKLEQQAGTSGKETLGSFEGQDRAEDWSGQDL